jgi:hypothetical protein
MVFEGDASGIQDAERNQLPDAGGSGGGDIFRKSLIES